MILNNTRDFRTMPELCLTEIKINLYTPKSYSYSGNSSGAINCSQLYFLEEGETQMHTVNETITANAGDFYYIPSNFKYSANSIGDKQLKYYLINFSFKRTNDSFFDQSYDLTKIEGMDKDLTLDKIKSIFINFEGTEVQKLTALSDFYKLFAEILPRLNKRNPLLIHPALAKAIEYIENHLLEDYSISTLAKICLISESRLYHLFQEQLKTTPINYKNKLKLKLAFKMLIETNLSISQIAEKLNFKSDVYFRRIFKEETSYSPKKYRKIFLNIKN